MMRERIYDGQDLFEGDGYREASSMNKEVPTALICAESLWKSCFARTCKRESEQM